jgi:APA family basic amino acid/polyamine antiporter
MPERQQLSFLEILAITLGAIFTTGVFVVPATVAGLLGYSSIWLWIGLAILSIPMGLSFASLASMFSRSGGPVIFVRTAFGDLAAFITGWSTWIYSTTAIAALAIITAQFFTVFIPMEGVQQVGLALGLLAIFTGINWFGVRNSARIEVGLIALAVVLMVLYIVLGLPTADFSKFNFDIPDVGMLGFAAVLGFELFIGWETATIIAEEVKHPKKHLPKALLVTVVVMAVLYTGVIATFMGHVDLDSIAGAANPLASTAEQFAGPLAWIFSLVAILVGLSALNSWTTTVARLPHVMAEHKLFLGYFNRLNKYGAPDRALALQLLLATVIALSGSFELAITLLLSVGLVMYIIVFASLLKLKGLVPAGFKVPNAFPAISIAALVLMIFSLPPSALLSGWLLILSGLPAFIAVKLVTDRVFVETYWDRVSFMWRWAWPLLLYPGGVRAKVMQRAALSKGMTILDYGSGTGVTTMAIAKAVPSARIVAADISKQQLTRAVAGAEAMKVGNIAYVKVSRPAPFPPSSFDRIVSTVAINYFVNPTAEMKALCRVLRKNGKAVFLAVRAPGVVAHSFLASDGEIKGLFRRACWRNVKVEREKRLLREYIYITAQK